MDNEILIEEIRVLNQTLQTLSYMIWTSLVLQTIRPSTGQPEQPPLILDLRTPEGRTFAHEAFQRVGDLAAFAMKEFSGSGQDAPPWVM